MHDVLVGFRKFAEVAKQHSVSKALVSSLVSKARKNPNFLKELAEKDKIHDYHHRIVAQEANDLIVKGVPIWKAAQIRTWVNFKNNLELKDGFVRGVLKSELGLQYRRVKLISPHSNSE